MILCFGVSFLRVELEKRKREEEGEIKDERNREYVLDV